MLREEGRTGTSGRGARLLRRGLVVAQVAFAFVLLAGAGLLFSSFQRVLAVDPGFRADHVLTGSVVLPRARFRENSSMSNFLNESLQRIRALPGVEAAGTTGVMPLSGNNNNSVIFAEGYQMKPGESAIAPSNTSVSPGFFEAMGVQLVSGRFFDDHDVAQPGAAPSAFGTNQPRVVIVDDRLARRFWPGQDPVGRRMFLPTDPNNLTAITPQTVFMDVVGVIKEMKLQSLTQEDEYVGAVYFPVLQAMPPAQAQGFGLNYAIRTSGDPAALGGALRQTIASLDRELALFDVLTMTERVDRSLVNRRSPVVLSLTFGAIALLLSAIGDLRRAGVRRHAADARNRDQACAGEQRAQDLRLDPSRGPRADRCGVRSGGGRGDSAAPEPAKPALPDLRDRSDRVDRRRGRAGAGGGGRLRTARAPRHPNRSGHRPR